MFVTSKVQRRHACLKIVNNKTKMNKTCVSSHRCFGSPVVRKKEFRLKEFYSLEEINLPRQNKITDFICLINHGIYPPNMYYIYLLYLFHSI